MEQMKPLKIDLNDTAAIKHRLDSTAAEVGSRDESAEMVDAVGREGCWQQRRQQWQNRKPLRALRRRCRCADAAYAAARAKKKTHTHPRNTTHTRHKQVILDAGYVEDHLISNVKIVLGALA